MIPWISGWQKSPWGRIPAGTGRIFPRGENGAGPRNEAGAGSGLDLAPRGSMGTRKVEKKIKKISLWPNNLAH